MARIAALLLAFASALAFLFEGAAAKEDFGRMPSAVDEVSERMLAMNDTATQTTTTASVINSAMPTSQGIPVLAAVVLACQGLRA